MASCSEDSVGTCSALTVSQTSLALEPLWNKIRSNIKHPLFTVHCGKTPRNVLVSYSCQLDIRWDLLEGEAQSEWLTAAWRVGVYNGLSWLLTDVEEPNPPWAAPLRGLCLNRGRVNWQRTAWGIGVSQLLTVDLTWLAVWVPAQPSPQQQTWNSELKCPFPQAAYGGRVLSQQSKWS